MFMNQANYCQLARDLHKIIMRQNLLRDKRFSMFKDRGLTVFSTSTKSRLIDT